MIVGYARVSTADQNLQAQTDALTAAGSERVYTDSVSGAKASRPGMLQALDACRAGDTLLVWKLDRLGRSTGDLISIAAGLEKRGVQFKSLTDNIDTSTASGRFFFNMMASLAQMERELTVERTHAGLASAKARGRLGGRPRILTSPKITAAKLMLANGMSAAETANNLGVSRATLYRHIPVTGST